MSVLVGNAIVADGLAALGTLHAITSLCLFALSQIPSERSSGPIGSSPSPTPTQPQGAEESKTSPAGSHQVRPHPSLQHQTPPQVVLFDHEVDAPRDRMTGMVFVFGGHSAGHSPWRGAIGDLKPAPPTATRPPQSQRGRRDGAGAHTGRETDPRRIPSRFATDTDDSPGAEQACGQGQVQVRCGGIGRRRSDQRNHPCKQSCFFLPLRLSIAARTSWWSTQPSKVTLMLKVNRPTGAIRAGIDRIIYFWISAANQSAGFVSAESQCNSSAKAGPSIFLHNLNLPLLLMLLTFHETTFWLLSTQKLYGCIGLG